MTLLERLLNAESRPYPWGMVGVGIVIGVMVLLSGCDLGPITQQEWIVESCDNGIVTVTHGFGSIADPDTTYIGPSDQCMKLARFQAEIGILSRDALLKAAYIKFTVASHGDSALISGDLYATRDTVSVAIPPGE